MHRIKIISFTVLSVLILSFAIIVCNFSFTIGKGLSSVMAVSAVPDTENQRIKLAPCGFTFGVKLYTQGIVIVGMTPVNTENGERNPAASAGLKTGDIINSVNSKNVDNISELNSIISKNGKKEIILNITRKNENFDIIIAAGNLYSATLHFCPKNVGYSSEYWQSMQYAVGIYPPGNSQSNDYTFEVWNPAAKK